MATPVRGTQSFVGVMGAVWRRPSLAGLEIAWRWVFGGVVLGLIWLRGGLGGVRLWNEYRASLEIAARGGFIFGLDVKGLATAFLVIAGIAVVWALVWAAMRMVILHELDPALRGRWGTMAVLAVARVMSLAVLLGVLLGVVFEIARVTVFLPMAAQAEPEYVLGFAGVLGIALTLFVVWSLVSWVLQLAPILAMARGLTAGRSVRAALREGPLRLKLVEINLVMGVVKVALIVLAMVFSASPLPFTSVATPMFLTCWWSGVVLLYFAMSDYFHVVRAAAYLTLWRTYHPERAS